MWTIKLIAQKDDCLHRIICVSVKIESDCMNFFKIALQNAI